MTTEATAAQPVAEPDQPDSPGQPGSPGESGSPGVRRAVRRLRANPDFRRMWVADAVSEAGSSLSALTFPLLVLAMTGSALSAGVVATVGFTASLLGQVPAGYLGDVVDRRRLLVGADLVRGVLLAGVAVIALTGWYHTPVVLVISAVGTVTGSLCGPAQVQVFRTVVSRADLAEASALTQGRGYALELATPSVGGVLFAVHRALPFVADALSFLTSAWLTARIRTPLGPDRSVPRPRFALAVASGWAELWRSRLLRWTTLFATVTNLAVTTLVYVVLFGSGASGAVVAGLGATVTAAAAVGLLGSALVPVVQRRLRLHQILLVGCGFRAVCVAPAFLSDHQVVRAFALVAVVFATPVTRSALSTARILHVPEQMLGRVTGAVGLVSTVSQPLAPLLGGLLIDRVGSAAAAGDVAVVFAALAVAVAFVPSLRVPVHE